MESARDQRVELERLALKLAFAADASADLAEDAPLKRIELSTAAARLRQQTDALAAEVGDDEPVVRLARTVLDGLGREFARARRHAPAPAGHRRASA
jgi:hypothetical protein